MVISPLGYEPGLRRPALHYCYKARQGGVVPPLTSAQRRMVELLTVRERHSGEDIVIITSRDDDPGLFEREGLHEWLDRLDAAAVNDLPF